MVGIIDLLMPKEKKFLSWLKEQIVLFEKSTQLVCQACQDSKIDRQKIQKVLTILNRQRKKQEEISKEIITSLHQTFITPIDSAEILSLTANINRLYLCLLKILSGLGYLRIEKIDLYFTDQLKILQLIAKELVLIFDNLLTKANIKRIAKIVELEDKADRLEREAIGQLFTGSTNPTAIIKYKELYELTEEAIDDAKAVADEIELILINHL